MGHGAVRSLPLQQHCNAFEQRAVLARREAFEQTPPKQSRPHRNGAILHMVHLLGGVQPFSACRNAVHGAEATRGCSVMGSAAAEQSAMLLCAPRTAPVLQV